MAGCGLDSGDRTPAERMGFFEQRAAEVRRAGEHMIAELRGCIGKYTVRKALLSTCLGLWLFAAAGCSRPLEPEPASESSSAEQRQYTGGEKLTVTYQTLPTSVLTDLDLVTAAVNEIAMEEIGVEIEFRLVDESDAFTQYPLWISKNEQIDLMMLNGQDIATYVSRGMLEPLDGLLEEYGQDILALAEEGIWLTEGAVIKDRIYGIAPVSELPGNGYGLWASARLVQDTGFYYEESHVYSLAELTDFLEKCKELYPESFPLGQITSDRKASTFAWFGGTMHQTGGASDFGILTEDGKVVNLYETKEYETFLQYLRQWYQAGFIYPDAAFTDAYLEELVKCGLVLTCPGSSAPDYEMDELFGEEAVCLRTSPVSMGHQSSRIGYWSVPVTSGNPEAAMKFLNLLYQDARVANLIQYGIASRHYVVLDVESGRISYPYGVSRKSTGYYNPLGLYGDRRKLYTFDTKEMLVEKQAYLQEAMADSGGMNTFSFETDGINLELAALQKIVEKYVPILESGSVELDFYEEFIRELQMAGSDRVVEEKQRQYDAWRLKNGG